MHKGHRGQEVTHKVYREHTYPEQEIECKHQILDTRRACAEPHDQGTETKNNNIINNRNCS